MLMGRKKIRGVVIGTQIVSLGGQSQDMDLSGVINAGCDWHSNCIFRWSITGKRRNAGRVEGCDWHSNCIFRWSITGPLIPFKYGTLL